MIYHIRNPKTDEKLTVQIESENDENVLRTLIAIAGWEIVSTE